MQLLKSKLFTHHYAKPSWNNGIGYLEDSRGFRLPGTTSIIQASKSPLQKAQLIRWQQKQGSDQIVKASKERGTSIHKLINNYLIVKASKESGISLHELINNYRFSYEPFSCPDSIEPYWNNLLPILENIDDIKLIEANLFHYYLGYAGRVDCVASYLGIPCIIEFKTSDRIKPLYDEPLQVSAYCGAANRQYGLKLKNTMLITTTPEETCVTWFEPDDVMENWHLWKQKVADFWKNNQIAS
ncbi:exonuclease [Brunnivagina elsteri]|uniref:Exonuclease n=1 Tax=Brunnivagina elsteri CCALA 953 TaxID=987040 RepID=A0A2A2TIA2_9CYAN|nr:exonuclease [Calothrix elsteri]PAX53421.1 exonuclease [Calothrix elsteri CCALA 953]